MGGTERDTQPVGYLDQGGQSEQTYHGSLLTITYNQYTAFYKRADPNVTIGVNYLGNNVKSMSVSLDDSLKKLRTTYVDIFYVHWWDYDTSIPELMNGLHNLVTQGKVLYLVRVSLNSV